MTRLLLVLLASFAVGSCQPHDADDALRREVARLTEDVAGLRMRAAAMEARVGALEQRVREVQEGLGYK